MERVLRIIACGLLAGALAGCGGGGIAEVDGRRHEGPGAHEGNLGQGAAGCPTASRLGPVKRGGRRSRRRTATAGAVLDAAAGRAPERALTAQAAASYQGDELGEQVGVGLAQYMGSEAEGHIAELARALESCRAVRAGGGTRLRRPSCRSGTWPTRRWAASCAES